MDIENKLLDLAKNIDFDSFTEKDVLDALSKDYLDFADLGALLSEAALNHLDKIATKSAKIRQQYFGNNVNLYTPIYIANYCTNACSYCGFSCKNNIKRGKLDFDQIEAELKSIYETGLDDILILTGESEYHSSVDYIKTAVTIAKSMFSSVGIEIYPLDESGYHKLKNAGADFVSVYQETYDKEVYDKVHLSGKKKDYSWRFNALERAAIAGFRGVCTGALLGLSDYRFDSFCAIAHLFLLAQKYPHLELSFSVPRLRPYINSDSKNDDYKLISEKKLLQVMCALRLFVKNASLSISTRESALFRDNAVKICATRMSAGVKTSVGGHIVEEEGDGQFDVNDQRSLEKIADALKKNSMQAVFTDYIYV